VRVRKLTNKTVVPADGRRAIVGVRTPSCYCARRRQLTVVVLSELDFECWFADRRTARKRFHYYIRVDRLSAVRVVYAYIYILITDSNNVILFEHSPLKRYARTYVINNDTLFTYFIVYGKSPASGTNEFVSDASEVILLLSSVFVVRLGRSIYRTRFVFYRVLAYYRYGDRGARFEKRTGNRRRQTGNAHVYYAYVRLIIVRDSFYGKYHRRRFPGRDCYSEIRPHCRPWRRKNENEPCAIVVFCCWSSVTIGVECVIIIVRRRYYTAWRSFRREYISSDRTVAWTHRGGGRRARGCIVR